MRAQPAQGPLGISWLERCALALIVILALGLRLPKALSWDLNYDELWHVFTGSVQPLRGFLGELHELTHPPLMYLLLRLLIPLSASPLAPRLVALLPALGAIPLLYLCARRLDVSRPIALLGALLLAVSPAHTLISICVRGYSLATLLLLLTYLYFLDVVDDLDATRSTVVTRCLFFAALSMWTEYCAIFVLLTMLLVLVLSALQRGDLRQIWKRAVERHRPALLGFGAAFLLLCGFMIWGTGPGGNGHLSPFLPGGGRSLARFVLSGTAQNLGYFLPVKPATDGALFLWLVGMSGGVAVLYRHILMPRAGDARRDLGRGSAVIIAISLWLLLLTLSLLRLYPFGGYMRHQFILFPFMLLATLQLLDLGYRRCRSRGVRVVLCGLAAIAALSWSRVTLALPEPDDVVRNPAWIGEAAAARAQMGKSPLYVTKYSMIGFYSGFRSARWRLEDRCGPECSEFRVTQAEQSFRVLKDAGVWTLPQPFDEATALRLRQLMDARSLAMLWLYSLELGPMQPDAAQTALLQKHGLRIDRTLRFPSSEALRLSRLGSAPTLTD